MWHLWEGQGAALQLGGHLATVQKRRRHGDTLTAPQKHVRHFILGLLTSLSLYPGSLRARHMPITTCKSTPHDVACKQTLYRVTAGAQAVRKARVGCVKVKCASIAQFCPRYADAAACHVGMPPQRAQLRVIILQSNELRAMEAADVVRYEDVRGGQFTSQANDAVAEAHHQNRLYALYNATHTPPPIKTPVGTGNMSIDGRRL